MLRTGPAQETSAAGPFPTDSRTAKRDLRSQEAKYYQAIALFKSGNYLKAEEAFQAAFAKSEEMRDRLGAARCLTAIGVCRLGMFRYRETLQSWLEAREPSERLADWVNLGSLDTNLATLYLEMGDLDAAADSADRAVADATRGGFTDGIARAEIELEIVRARQGRLEESARAAEKAVELAEREGNLGTAAEAWDHFGEELLAHRSLPEADRTLTEAFRWRKLHRLTKLDSSYYNLARLRLLQGDAPTALHLVDAILAPGHHPDSQISVWAVRDTRGRALTALGRTAEAFREFHAALDAARQWRVEVLPADFTRISSEIQLSQIYSDFIDAGNKLYFAGGPAALVRQTFEAAEENRSVTLHLLQALPSDWRQKLPAKYWEALARLHSTETRLLADDSEALRHEMRSLRSTVLEMEAQAGANPEISSAGLAEHTQSNLARNAALLSFHLGEPESFLWAISRERLRLYRLPGMAELAKDVTGFAGAVSTHNTTAASRGYALYQKLFGQLEPVFQGKPRWIVALDQQLFQAPLAALVTGWSGGTPDYLVERHSLRLTTGALNLRGDDPGSWRTVASGKFLGVGDAIYNAADPRWTGHRSASGRFLPWQAVAATNPANDLAMPRLAGTGAEVELCARTWNAQTGNAILLRGADAAPDRFETALRRQPTVIHIAGHFREASIPPHYSMIALSLAPSGEPQWLSPLEITRTKVPPALVVLSGCSSGRGDAIPGSGLMGLTRAWLAAGARAVVASHWPTPDDRGALFIDFYKYFKETPDAGPAVALQRAQLDMLHAGGWRADPQYWATYFVSGDL